MEKRRLWVERVKTALIILLIAGAVLTGWRSRLLDDFFKGMPSGGERGAAAEGENGQRAPEPGGIPLKESARPIAAAVTRAGNARYGVRYDTEARNFVYDRTSSVFGEALGSVSGQAEISEEEWRAALSSPNVYYEYPSPVRLSVLAGWFGSRLPDTAPDAVLKRIFVAAGTARNTVYFENDENGAFYSLDTASIAGTLGGLGVFEPNGAVFAFETGVEAGEKTPYTLIMSGSEHAVVAASSPGSAEELIDLTLRALGHGDETYTPPYYNNDGLLMRVGTQFSIMADTQGGVTYRRTDFPENVSGGTGLSDGEVIEAARTVTANTLGLIKSGAEVFFESIKAEADGSRTVEFCYFAAGGRIRLYDEGFAARVTVTGTVISGAEFVFRSYAIGEDTVPLLPEKLALASADGAFELLYTDTGEEKLYPVWVKAIGNS